MTIRRVVDRGELPAMKLAGKMVVLGEDWKSYEEQCTANHTPLVKRANTRFLCIRYYDENGRRKFLSTGFEDEKRALGELANFIKHEERERLSVAPSVFECLKYYFKKS